ncbi:MAG: shikimate dehydrogenase family protein, partial [Acidimicrobiales bacterium]
MDRWSPTGSTRLVAVIGDPVGHSLSPAIHNAAFAATGRDWVFVALPVQVGDAAFAVDAVRHLGVLGLSVTTPHKDAVALLVNRLSPVATALGAVNTVSLQGDQVVGDSTDGAGFLDAVRLDQGFDPAGRRCVV